jgi:hypothetical protein
MMSAPKRSARIVAAEEAATINEGHDVCSP